VSKGILRFDDGLSDIRSSPSSEVTMYTILAAEINFHSPKDNQNLPQKQIHQMWWICREEITLGKVMLLGICLVTTSLIVQ